MGFLVSPPPAEVFGGHVGKPGQFIETDDAAGLSQYVAQFLFHAGQLFSNL
ncbi:hypothetical protein [Amycolatopsis circi]|uniref:hypothetical protein n=1 Tax=Amycolatopsis circi TaxID=871959 RepID=UPI0013BEA66D|nr:hypothetical protein [Amycolatopsis circi]